MRPLSFATGAGAEVQKPLATVVIAGLVSSTVLTLLVLPTIYTWFDRGRPIAVSETPEEAPPLAGAASTADGGTA